jgi:hypothetical protein
MTTVFKYEELILKIAQKRPKITGFMALWLLKKVTNLPKRPQTPFVTWPLLIFMVFYYTSSSITKLSLKYKVYKKVFFAKISTIRNRHKCPFLDINLIDYGRSKFRTESPILRLGQSVGKMSN